MINHELFSLLSQEWIQFYPMFFQIFPVEKICLRQICQDEQLSCLRFVDCEIKVVDFELISHDMILLKQVLLGLLKSPSPSDIRKDAAGKHKDLVVVEGVIAALREASANVVVAAAESTEEMILSAAIRSADA